MNIGFIGIGVMGASMARNLLRAGHAVHVYTRTRAKAEAIVADGAVWHDSVQQCTAGRDAVITMVGSPQDVEQVYFGPGGILASADPNTALVDMTTTSPKLAKRIAAEASRRGLGALDAPVSGGDVGAQRGTLTIMVGGERAVYEACLPMLRCMGTNISLVGPAGCGQHMKMANQIAVAGAMAGVCEAIAYARSAGLDAQCMVDTIAQGAAGSWQLANNAPRMLRGDMAPGFAIRHFIKDMGLAHEEAGERGLVLPVLDAVLAMYRDLAEHGMAELGTQALIAHYTGETPTA